MKATGTIAEWSPAAELYWLCVFSGHWYYEVTEKSGKYG